MTVPTQVKQFENI